jgi:hypothetical protein
MRFQNKILKLALRYTKENGMYIQFVNELRKLTSDEELLIKSCEHNTPLCILEKTKIIKKDFYSDDFIKYLCNTNEEKILKLFNNFLEENNIKEQFYNNINENYIKRHVTPREYKEKIENTKEPIELLKILYPITGFIMHGFYWEGTKEGHNFWSRMNKNWIEFSINTLPQYI